MQISRIRLSDKTHAFSHERSSTVHPTNDTGSCYPDVTALTERPAHSCCHRILRHASPEASTISLPPQLLRLLPAGAVAGWGFHPLEKRRLPTAHAKSGRSYRQLNWKVLFLHLSELKVLLYSVLLRRYFYLVFLTNIALHLLVYTAYLCCHWYLVLRYQCLLLL